jgi:hypothetical protein
MISPEEPLSSFYNPRLSLMRKMVILVQPTLAGRQLPVHSITFTHAVIVEGMGLTVVVIVALIIDPAFRAIRYIDLFRIIFREDIIVLRFLNRYA